jgi:hypothetical protein
MPKIRVDDDDVMLCSGNGWNDDDALSAPPAMDLNGHVW